MSTITLPNIRVGSDLQIRVRLKDGGVAIDWSTLSNIKACIYSDAQRALAGRCAFSIDEEDNTLLVCTYAANKPQYLGVNRIVISAKYMGETKTYDKPAFSFVRWTADQEGEEITIDDPDVDVEIDVEDISSSILQEAVDAAFTAADRANDAAEAAEHMVDIHTGPEGKSAYEVAVDEGFVGTEEEWLASLVGPQGAQGIQGETGEAAGFGSVSAALQEDGGDPSVVVAASGEDTSKNFAFTFKNLKGDKGDKGDQGNTGSSVDYPYELVNNLTTDDATKGLAASQGVALQAEVSQLEAEIHGINNTITPTWTQGKRLNESGQVINSGNQLYVSDFIPAYPGTTTIIHGARGYATINMPCALFYNESKTTVLGYKYGQGDVDISTELATLNPAYIRLSHYDSGSTLPVTGVYVTAYLVAKFATTQYVQDTVQEAIDEVPVVTTERNTQFPDILEGYRTSVNGKYLQDGVLINNANWCSMEDYAPISANTKYALARNYVSGMVYITFTAAFYKADKTYISNHTGVANNAFTTPADSAYIRISVTNTNFSANGEDNFDNIYLAEANDGNSVHTIDTYKIVVNGFPKTALFGKKWALFGDSITEKNFRSNLNYHDYIRSEMNVITHNFAIGGAGYKNRDDSGKAIYQTIYANKDSLKDFDFITIMGGVNDCTRGTFSSIIGTIDDEFSGSDYSGVTNNTIFACFKKSIELIFQYAPLVHIAIISPLPAVTSGFTFNPDDDANNMSVFVSGCKQICERYGIPYLDLYHTSGLRPWDDTVNNTFFRCISSDSPDRLHPNEYGHKWFYPQVREFIKKLI